MSALSSEPASAARKRHRVCLDIPPASGGFDDAGSNRIGRCQSYVKRNRDAGRLARVGVHPVIEPAREGNKQPGFGSDSDRFPVRVARRAHGLHADTRIEELQPSAERAIRVELTGVHVIDTGPGAVRVGVWRMVGALAADRRPRPNGQLAFECTKASRGIDHLAYHPGDPRSQRPHRRFRTIQEIGPRVPASDVATTHAQITGLFREDERLQVLIHRFGVWHPQLTDDGGECLRNFEFHRTALISRALPSFAPVAPVSMHLLFFCVPGSAFTATIATKSTRWMGPTSLRSPPPKSAIVRN